MQPRRASLIVELSLHTRPARALDCQSSDRFTLVREHLWKTPYTFAELRWIKKKRSSRRMLANFHNSRIIDMHVIFLQYMRRTVCSR